MAEKLWRPLFYGYLFFPVDTTGAGDGLLAVDIARGSRNIPVRLVPDTLGHYKVNFTPDTSGQYAIQIYFAGLEVTGNHEVIGAYSVIVNAYLYSSSPKKHSSKKTNFDNFLLHEKVRLHMWNKQYTVFSWVRQIAHPHTRIRFSLEIGKSLSGYPLLVLTASMNVYVFPLGSPFRMEVVDSVDVTVSGEGLGLVPVNQQTEFLVHAPRVTTGISALQVTITCKYVR